MNALLEVTGLSHRYGSVVALAGLELTLERGEVLGLLGVNGAGKTTCLRLLSGNLAPPVGAVRICGQDLARRPVAAKSHLGYLPERPPLYLELTVDEYLSFSARLRRVPRRRIAHAVALAKTRCGLGAVGRRLIGQLSKGYRQRVGIAQAIVHEPDLLILDEPTDGLDPLQIRETRDLIRALAAYCGVILSSHRLAEVQSVCSRALVLGGGRVLYRTDMPGRQSAGEIMSYRLRLEAPPPRETLEALDGVTAAALIGPGLFRLSLAPSLSAAELLQRAVESGWRPSELTPERTDLEQVFVDILNGDEVTV